MFDEMREMLGRGDPLTLRPTPWLGHLSIGAGDASLDDLLAAMDRGLVVGGVLGAHSGNVPNGDSTTGASAVTRSTGTTSTRSSSATG